jgi:hypothetical protein
LHKTFDINELDAFSCLLQTLGAIKEGGMSMEGWEKFSVGRNHRYGQSRNLKELRMLVVAFMNANK